jgi:hypothetical protein
VNHFESLLALGHDCFPDWTAFPEWHPGRAPRTDLAATDIRVAGFPPGRRHPCRPCTSQLWRDGRDGWCGNPPILAMRPSPRQPNRAIAANRASPTLWQPFRQPL